MVFRVVSQSGIVTPGGQLPNRGRQILLFTMVGVLLCGLMNFFAHRMAREDLQMMDQKTMSREGESFIRTLKVINFVMILVWITGALLAAIYSVSAMTLWS